MRVTQVKLLQDGVTLKWETSVGEDDTRIRHTLSNGGEPTPRFVNAVAELKDDIQTAMEYTKKYMETVTPTGFSVTYDDEGTGTVALAFKKKFRSGQVKGYSCPQKRQRTDHTENGSTFMDDDQWARVRVVLQAAERYIEKGERAQTEH